MLHYVSGIAVSVVSLCASGVRLRQWCYTVLVVLHNNSVVTVALMLKVFYCVSGVTGLSVLHSVSSDKVLLILHGVSGFTECQWCCYHSHHSHTTDVTVSVVFQSVPSVILCHSLTVLGSTGVSSVRKCHGCYTVSVVVMCEKCHACYSINASRQR